MSTCSPLFYEIIVLHTHKNLLPAFSGFENSSSVSFFAKLFLNLFIYDLYLFSKPDIINQAQ